MLDFLNVLSDDAVQELDIVDTEGWTALHRVAAYGTSSEVLELLRLGALPEQEALPLRWTAIHHAVFYGNEATYKALIPHFGHYISSMTDERRWTLLHIAASAGYDAIVRDLLYQGADPSALSKPFWSHMPESLYGRECTPREIAAAQSQEREQRYLSVLSSCGMDSTAVKLESTDDDDDDVFYDAPLWSPQSLA